mmetsp:Transcript_2938/g.4771  ORF Transcript_2938/g.4771 Transcript_2938/m.4771 type:complete len:396 (-) Transcript_2938:16-1203(-)
MMSFRRLLLSQRKEAPASATYTWLAAAAASASLWSLSSTRTDTEAAAAADHDSIHSLSPTPPLYYFYPNEDLEICFDTRTRTPVYVMERLRPPAITSISSITPKKKASTTTPARRRRPHFVEETKLPEIFRSRNSHYQGSGYDRGHMAPAADFHDIASTFVLTNVCPQVPTLNRKLWNRLEHWVRLVAAREEGCTTMVVTGPLWLPDRTLQSTEGQPSLWEYRYPAIGRAPSLISVPTHFFKLVAILTKDGGRIAKYAAFVVPNNDYTNTENELNGTKEQADDDVVKRQQPRQEMEPYLVRWSDFEAVVGLQFFPTLVPIDFESNKNWKRLADQATELVWNEEQPCNPEKRLLQLTASPLVAPSSTSSRRWRRGKKKSRLLEAAPEHLCRGGVCQ